MNKIQLKTRPVVVRRELFDHYSELGLTEKDLIVLIKLIYASETSNKQPSIDELKLGSDMEPREITSIIQTFNSKGFIATSCEKGRRR